MNFYHKLERRFGKYAIPNLMNYLVILYGAGAVICFLNPVFYTMWLSLNVERILHGEVWRLFTFLIYPPSSGSGGVFYIFFNCIMLYLYYNIGTTLERVWGAFRFNVYMFMGVFGHILAAFFIYFGLGQIWLLDPSNLNMSIFLAFAMTFPDLQFLLYFVIPIKAKWLAAFYVILQLYSFLMGGAASKVTIALSFLNFVIFFVLTRNHNRVSPRTLKRKREFKEQAKILPRGTTHHKCAVCGRTEKDDENLEFRYCSKCAGTYEYCMDHLYTHRHVTPEDIANPENKKQ